MSPRPSPLARVMLAAIGLYQTVRAGRPSPCRFIPSCSHYAHEAVELHGGLRGGWLAVRRLVRCRPLGPHGVDLVPAPEPGRRLPPVPTHTGASR